MTIRQAIFTLVFFSLLAIVHGQQDRIIDSLTKTWSYQIFPDTQKVKVIDYYPVTTRCGRALNYSMAICFITTGQTIRIIEQCPDAKAFKHGDVITFIPSATIPADKNLYLPYIDGDINPFILKYSQVRITTYGLLSK